LISEFAGYRQAQLADGRFELVRGAARFLDAQTLGIAITTIISEDVRVVPSPNAHSH
jgi:hypothetical protein